MRVFGRCGQYLAGDYCEKQLAGECPARMWGPNCDQECKCNIPFNCTRSENDKGLVCRCTPNELIDENCRARSEFNLLFCIFFFAFSCSTRRKKSPFSGGGSQKSNSAVKFAPFRVLSPHSKLWYRICSQMVKQ